MNIFPAVISGLKRLWSIIVNPSARRAVQRAAELVELALPIVQELSKFNPKTARLSEILDAYEHYGVPVVTAYAQNPVSLGNALFNLATELLRRKSPDNSSNILNTSVQLAVTAIKAK